MTIVQVCVVLWLCGYVVSAAFLQQRDGDSRRIWIAVGWPAVLAALITAPLGYLVLYPLIALGRRLERARWL